jgi:hypothetical protein
MACSTDDGMLAEQADEPVVEVGNSPAPLIRAGHRQPETKVLQDDGVDHGHVRVDGGQQLARERRLVSTDRSVETLKHLGERNRPTLAAFEQVVERVLPTTTATHPVEVIESPLELGV